MLRSILLFFLFLFLSNATLAQKNKPHYALLWEISGKDFTEKSYLFGTMHLRDERVFELCDSVMLGIEACKGFAVEVHPDSILSYILEREMRQDTTDQIGAMIDSIDLQLNPGAGELQFDSLLKKQPDLFKNLLTSIKEGAATKKRPQMLDFTLFGYAKDREKSLHGLESMHEYKDLAAAYLQHQTTGSSTDMLIENLVEMYRKGDIEAIYKSFDLVMTDQKLHAEMFTNRNVRMVENMKKLGAVQSTFFAMGAGHLPGDDGVIALLRQAGYTVRKVKGTFTGVADSLFKANKPRDLGIDFSDPAAGFSVQFSNQPFFKPFSMAADGGHVISGRTHTVLDLRRGFEFSTLTMQYPAPLLFSDKREMLNMLDEEYKTIFGPRMGEPQDVKIDGYPGKHLKYRMRTGIMEMQLMMRGNRLYAFTVSHPPMANQAPTQAFFKSIRIAPPTFSPLTPTDILETGSRVSFPGKYVSINDSVSYAFPTESAVTTSALDTLSSTLYNVVEYRWSDYFTLTDTFLANFMEGLVTDTFSVLRDTVFRSVPAYLLTINNVQGQYFADHLILPTDEGFCELMVIKPEAGNNDRSWAFFNSFETSKKWTGARKTGVYKQRMFAHVNSPDSTAAAQALAALRNANLTAEDVPAVLELLKQPMPEDTFLWGSKHRTLWESMLPVKDARILPFAESYFKLYPDRTDRQEYALEALLSQQSDAETRMFFELAPQLDSLQAFGDYECNNLFKYLDSAFVVSNRNRLMQLRAHPAFRHLVISALNDLFKESAAIRDMFTPFAADFIKDAWQLVSTNRLLDSKDTMPVYAWQWTLLNYIDLAGYFPENSGNVDFLKKAVGLPSPVASGAAINSLFRLGQKVDVKILERWHEDPSKWYDVLSSLDQEAYLQKIPARLLDAATFIEGCVPGMLYDYDYSELVDFKVIEKRKYDYQGQKLLLYVFTYRLDPDTDADELYLGVCGFSEKGGISLNPPIINTTYEPYDKNKLEKTLKTLLEGE